MSQQKVDHYKQTKARRKEIIRRQKRIRALKRLGMTVVALALVAWLGHSVYSHVENSRPAQTAEISYDSVNDYLSGLTADETADAADDTAAE